MKSPKFVKRLLTKTIHYVAKHPEQFAVAPGAFTRNGFWNIEKLLQTMLSMDCHDLYTGIYNTLTDAEIKRGVNFTTSGFIQKRDKLTVTMLEFVFRTIVKGLSFLAQNHTFLGYHLLACDGSDFPLPTECIPSAPNADVQRKVQHRLLHQNALYDVLAKIYIAVTMEPKLECSERNSLLYLAESLYKQDTIYKPEKTIITCDRGYESSDVFMKLTEMGYKFVIRVKGSKSRGIMHKAEIALPEEGKFADTDLTVYCDRNQKGIYKKARKPSLNSHALPLRVVAFKTKGGNEEYLLTNLSREEFSSRDIAAIYRKRWNIEVSFRHQKYAIGGIVFHSKKLNAQRMELYIALTLYNCISAIVQLSNIPSNKENQGYKINFSTAVPQCIRYLFCCIKGGWETLERQLIQNLIKQVDNRNYERKLKPKSARAFNARVR